MIDSFHIRGFRGYPDTNIMLGRETCIIGGNGSGKTHILEGIHLASGGNIHYIQAPKEEDIGLEICFSDTVGPKHYGRERREKKERYTIQGSSISGIKYIQNLPFRTVFVSPFDMNLFYFAPSMRRDLVDDILERTFGQFRIIRREYESIVRQRNAVLKKIREGEASKKDLSYWNQLFIEKAHLYHLYRMKWVQFVAENHSIIDTLLPKYHIRHHYISRIQENMEKYDEGAIEGVIGKYLEEHIERDIQSGHTHIGPHLDDFTFLVYTVDDPLETTHECGLFLSRGENKVLLLALKQIEILFVKKYLDLPIVLLFDDIFAELDFLYAGHIIHSLDADQLIMTSQRALPEGEKWEHFTCINLEHAYDTKNSIFPSRAEEKTL